MFSEGDANRWAAEILRLETTNAALVAENQRLLTLVATLEARVAALEAAPSGPPPPVKPNPPRPDPATKPPRKKRAAAHNHGRRRATPTEIRTHAYDACPTCAYPLRGTSLARRREVLDLPLLTPVQVIE